MVCHLQLPDEGMLGLRVRLVGGLTTVTYKTDLDERISFSAGGWKTFLQTENLQIGQAILITARSTSRSKLNMVLIVHVINDLPASSEDLVSESGSESGSE
jgi:hypothetical protein